MKLFEVVILLILSTLVVSATTELSKMTESENCIALKQQVIASVKVDIEEFRKEDSRGGTLGRFIKTLQDASFQSLMQPGAIAQLEFHLKFGEASDESTTSFARYVKQFTDENASYKKKIAKEAINHGRALLDQAIASKTLDDLSAVNESLREKIRYYQSLPGSIELNYASSFYRLKHLTESIKGWKISCADGNWAKAGEWLTAIDKMVRRDLSELATKDEANVYMDDLPKNAGLPMASEVKNLLNHEIDALLDDANQDQLSERLAKMESDQQLFVSLSNTYYRNLDIDSWKNIYVLAKTLLLNVERVKKGEVSKFQPAEWFSENPEMKSLIADSEFIKRISSYKVRVTNMNGKISLEPLCHDLNQKFSYSSMLSRLLKKEFPVDYKKGAEDISKSIAEEVGTSDQECLVVPAAKLPCSCELPQSE